MVIELTSQAFGTGFVSVLKYSKGNVSSGKRGL